MSWLLKEVKELNCTVAAAFNCDLSPVTERVNYAMQSLFLLEEQQATDVKFQ